MRQLLDIVANAGLRFKAPAIFDPRSRDPLSDNDRLQEIWCIWIDGYDAALSTPNSRLIEQLETVKLSERRAMFEGAFAGLATLFLQTSDHAEKRAISLVNTSPELSPTFGLGLGSAVFHLGRQFPVNDQQSCDYSTWMALDAFGFHQALFNWQLSLLRQFVPIELRNSPMARRAYDQGLGRGMWFAGHGKPELILSMLDAFPEKRQHDLWFGLGLMVAFWGGCAERDIRKLASRAGRHRARLQAGVGLAAYMRYSVDEVADYTEETGRLVCNAGSAEIAFLARAAQEMTTAQGLSAIAYQQFQNVLTEQLSS